MSISVSAASNNPLLLAAQQQHNHQHPILRYTNFNFRTELPQFQWQNNDHREAHDGIDCRSIHGLERGTNGLSPRWNAMSTMMVFWWICWLGNGAAATTDFLKGGGGSAHEQGIIIGGKIPAINGIYLNFASYIHLHSFRPWPCTMHRPWTMPPPEQLLHNRPPHILTSRPSIGIQNEDPLRRTRGPHAIHISCSITSLLQWIFCHDTKTKPAAEGEGFHSTSRRRHGR